ncbi:Rne/Rng family ribonuclease [Myxacorys almedinensis]|uniref:Rne/Rng family ribonuclease n=1 Tax=Myxacorys almedinensis A TaxID=2690445 RepID=A0A8J7YYP7_9CYAN|nr:Rne/Rng family ribonuclease [Myxacorys almedinensis]NDJ17017.1 Rne/Rng family ribonuclease [Myxacorys almedinensis A]
MPKQIVIAEQHRIAAVFSEDQTQELIVATGSHQVSDIYLGVVENVLPGIDAAFVNIGDSERNGFIHVSDLGPLRLKRSAGSITELLAPQQKVLVQVMKEPTGNKGPRLTGNISMPGRYLVLMPFGRGVNLSRRIRSENERNRLRALAILVKPAGMGIVIRTEAEGMPEEAIMEDLENLQRQWESILQEANSTRAPALLNRDDDFIQRVLRDVYSADVNRIVVDSHTGLKRVKQQLMNWGAGKLPQGVLIDHHRDRVPILEYFRVNAAIREALKPRVDLPSGGYIIIERTEALTVIDVNSGSFTRSATARETVLWTNCEAATEIARQLRLRNIAGVIIVDFIDMDARRDQLQVLEHFNKALRTDKAKPQISQLSELGLIELTRKRQGKNIYELFGRPCPTCSGLGHLVHLPGESHDDEGEGTERSAIAPREREPRRAEPRRDPPELGRISRDIPAATEPLWDGGEESEFDGNDQDLDILHHPSYQERNRSGNSRRRRNGSNRREGFTREAPSKASPWEEPNRYSAPTPAPTRTEYPARAEYDLEVEEESAPAEETFTPREREPRFSEERRGRSRRGSMKPVLDPPEVVHIEMTPEEQDVYAWMGVSPLILTDRELKNPKSAIVAVTLPGEAPPEALVAPAVANGTEDISEDNGSEDTGSEDSYEGDNIAIDDASNPNDSLTEVEFSAPPSFKSEPSQDQELAAPADDKEPPRRRRRRSSATVAD